MKNDAPPHHLPASGTGLGRVKRENSPGAVENHLVCAFASKVFVLLFAEAAEFFRSDLCAAMWAALVAACAGVPRPAVWEDCAPLAADGAAKLEAGDLGSGLHLIFISLRVLHVNLLTCNFERLLLGCIDADFCK